MWICFPPGNYLVSVANDGWHFLDVRGGLFLQGANTPASADAAQYTCAAFHPDGLILGTGSTAGSLRIWDVRTMENPHTLAGHGAAMTCLTFSENGYQAACAAPVLPHWTWRTWPLATPKASSNWVCNPGMWPPARCW